VPPEVSASIKNALLNANKTEQGRAMLKKLNFTSFEPATAQTYRGYSALLEHVIGY